MHRNLHKLRNKIDQKLITGMGAEQIHIISVLVFYSNKSKDYLRMDGVVAKKPKALKSECCEKFKKGNRCKRCPCFDLL